MINKNVLFLLYFICCTLSAGSPFTSGPIQIQSDSASLEQKHRQAIHEGNVILTQGAHELRADKLIIKKDETGKLNSITAFGSPAKFSGKLNQDPQPLFATAKTIHYYPDKQLVILEGSATVEHQNDKFQGPLLSYQLDKQIISAKSLSKERPIITIAPRV